MNNLNINQDERSYIETLVNEINEEHKRMDADSLLVHDIKLDLKDEATGESIYNLEDPIENALKYRNDFSRLGMSFECDVAIRTMVIFSKVFPYVTRDGRRIELQKCEGEGNPYQYNKEKLKFQMGNFDEHEYVYRGDIMNSYMGTINAYKRAFGDELPLEARMFVRFAHTIGNIMPVPFVRKGEEFNSPRGFNNRIINDYWDLTLLAIYNWFLKQNGKVPMYDLDLIDVVQTNESVLMCEKWLGNFRNKNGKLSWDEFVRRNYMGAFVEKQDTLLWNYEEGIYGMPKELWDNHFKTFRDETRPVSEEEYMQYFTKTRAAISERGYRISRGLIRAQRREIAMKLGENILMPGISFEEYSQDVFDNSFTDKDKENTKKMWDLLSSITPFEDYERDFIEDNLYPNIGDVVTFSYYREHMDEEIYNQLKEMMEFIYDNPGNEFLTAMIVDFLV